MMPKPGQGQGQRWPEIIDGWVRNPKIRRDGIRALAMLLASMVLVLVILICSGQLATLWHWTLSTLAGRVFGSCVAATVLACIGMRHLRRTCPLSARDERARNQDTRTHREDNDRADEGKVDVHERPTSSDNDEA